MRDEVPEGFFVQVDTDVVVRAYTDVMMWVQRHPKYFEVLSSDRNRSFTRKCPLQEFI